MTKLNRNITNALNKKRLGIYEIAKESKVMKNWQHVEANDHHGHFIEDADTGRTVCDLYVKIPDNVTHRFFDFDNAEEHVRLLVEAPMMQHLLERISAIHSGRRLSLTHGDLQDSIDDVTEFLKRFES